MAILNEILRKRKERLASEKGRAPLKEIKSRIEGTGAPLDFYGAIRRKDKINLIAEVKKASPSMGLIRADFDPARIAAAYKERAAAISVLTEVDFFQGSLSYLDIVKNASGRPVLRKDFIFDEYQIFESRAAGADAFLLIAKLLEFNQAGEFLAMARELGLGVLFETHDLRDLEAALRLEAPAIGINNRDLETMKVDLETTFALKAEIPEGGSNIVVSESGIRSRADVERLEAAGVDVMLIGTSLMKSPDIAKKIDELMGAHAGK